MKIALLLILSALPLVVGVGALAYLMNSARRKVEADPEARERERRAEQLAYAGALAGGLVHEIKNPLNSLSLNLQLLAEEWANAETPEQRRALKRIQMLLAETNRLAGTLDDFLGFARGQPLQPAPCDVNKLIEEVASFIAPELESKQVELRKCLEPLPQCTLDGNLLRQALMNLLLNAKEAMEEGRPREIILRSAAADGWLRIDVIDTGRGIPSENMEKIFEAFYSTRKGGTGLGLPTARRIVEQHEGHLLVHSEPGKGSCFTLVIPVAPRHAPAAPKPKEVKA